MSQAQINKAVKTATRNQYKTFKALTKAGDAGKTLKIHGNQELYRTLSGWGFFVEFVA